MSSSDQKQLIIPDHVLLDVMSQEKLTVDRASYGSASNSLPESQDQPPYIDSKSILLRELIYCLGAFCFGVYSPVSFFRPIFGVNMRPIPYQVLNSGDVVLDLGLKHELVEDVTIPSNLLLHSSITFPLAAIVIISNLSPHPLCRTKYVDTHSAVCALLLTIGLSEFITQMIKMYVGRLRPNFYELCGFDPTTLQCTASEEIIMESRSSFPSGHSSLSAAGMGILVWFLLGRASIGLASLSSGKNVKNSSRGGSSCRNPKISAFLAILPLSWPLFVASSRLVDNWHHPSDIVAGLCLGFFVPSFFYHLYYPSVISSQAGVPLKYLASVTQLHLGNSATCNKDIV